MRTFPCGDVRRKNAQGAAATILLLVTATLAGCGAAKSSRSAFQAGKDFAAAQQAWEQGSSSGSDGEDAFWSRAATDLKNSVVLGAPNASSDKTAIGQLGYLATLPAAGYTHRQNVEMEKAIPALNLFFGTNGLYGVSAPSHSLQAFVATLQEEARSGRLSASEPPNFSQLPAVPGAHVSCPVLASLSSGSAFACKIISSNGPTWMIGEIQSPHATQYVATAALSEPDYVFGPPCSAFFDPAELVALRQIGGTCTSSSPASTTSFPGLWVLPYNAAPGQAGFLYPWPDFPAEIVNFTSDNESYYYNLQWSSASSTSATAHGTFCSLPVPNNPPSTCDDIPVTLNASNPQRCSANVLTNPQGSSQTTETSAYVFNDITVTPAIAGWTSNPAKDFLSPCA